MNIVNWKKRLCIRSDMTTQLIHLTKDKDGKSADYWLWKILTEKALKAFGGTNIPLNCKCVCFQEVPIFSIAEVLLAETIVDPTHARYSGYGIRIDKQYIFNKGGRHVVYGSPGRKYLDHEWRYSHTEYKTENYNIDWSHEREWRIPENVIFEYKDIDIILPSVQARRKLISQAKESKQEEIIEKVRSIIVLEQLYS